MTRSEYKSLKVGSRVKIRNASIIADLSTHWGAWCEVTVHTVLFVEDTSSLNLRIRGYNKLMPYQHLDIIKVEPISLPEDLFTL